MPGVSIVATSAPRPPVGPPAAGGDGTGFGSALGAVCAALGRTGFALRPGTATFGLGVGAAAFGGGVSAGVGVGAGCTVPMTRSPGGPASICTRIIGGEGGG